MTQSRPCKMCGLEVVGRKDKTICSPACKRKAKNAYDIARYPQHRETKVAAAVQWQADNRVRKQAYDARHRAETFDRDRDRRKLSAQIYASGRHEENRLKASQRRATKQANGSFAVTPRDSIRMLARVDNHCYYCAGLFTESNPLEWDHIIPIRRGGTHGVGNLAPSCRKCNRSKSIRLVMEWRIGKVVSKASVPNL